MTNEELKQLVKMMGCTIKELVKKEKKKLKKELKRQIKQKLKSKRRRKIVINFDSQSSL